MIQHITDTERALQSRVNKLEAELERLRATESVMPRNYNHKTGKWVGTYKGSGARSDVRNPCSLCGWGPHMAIHGVPGGTEPAGIFGLHSWVPHADEPAQNPLISATDGGISHTTLDRKHDEKRD